MIMKTSCTIWNSLSLYNMHRQWRLLFQKAAQKKIKRLKTRYLTHLLFILSSSKKKFKVVTTPHTCRLIHTPKEWIRRQIRGFNSLFECLFYLFSFIHWFSNTFSVHRLSLCIILPSTHKIKQKSIKLTMLH